MGGDVGGICRSLQCQSKNRQDGISTARSSTENEGVILPTLIGGGELVSTDDSVENQCNLKNAVPTKCKS